MQEKAAMQWDHGSSHCTRAKSWELPCCPVSVCPEETAPGWHTKQCFAYLSQAYLSQSRTICIFQQIRSLHIIQVVQGPGLTPLHPDAQWKQHFDFAIAMWAAAGCARTTHSPLQGCPDGRNSASRVRVLKVALLECTARLSLRNLDIHCFRQ